VSPFERQESLIVNHVSLPSNTSPVWEVMQGVPAVCTAVGGCAKYVHDGCAESVGDSGAARASGRRRGPPTHVQPSAHAAQRANTGVGETCPVNGS